MQSALDIGFKWIEDPYPGFSVYLFFECWSAFIITVKYFLRHSTNLHWLNNAKTIEFA